MTRKHRGADPLLAERKELDFDPLPDADNAAVGSHC